MCNPDERLQLSLPVKLGGLAIPIFKNKATAEYSNSKQACEQHIRNIKNQTVAYTINNEDAIRVRKEISSRRTNTNHQLEETVKSGLMGDSTIF